MYVFMYLKRDCNSLDGVLGGRVFDVDEMFLGMFPG